MPENKNKMISAMPEGMSVSRKKASRIKTLIRSVFFAVVCASLIAGTFVWEQAKSGGGLSYAQEIEVSDYMRGMKEDNFTLAVSDEEADEYVYTVSEGRLWGNFSSVTDDVNLVLGGKVVLIPSFSNFDLMYNGETVELYNHKGNTYVGLMANEINGFRYMDEYDDVFENVLLVPAGVKIKIPLSKVDSRLSQLLLAKLVKEFSYSFFNPDLLEKDTFVKENLTVDMKFAEDLKSAYRDEFKEGAREAEEVSYAILDWLSKNLLVFEGKKKEYYSDKLNRYVYRALSAESGDERRDALTELEVLKSYLPDGYYDTFLKRWINDLVVFGAADAEIEVLNFMLNEARNRGVANKLDLLALEVGAYDSELAYESVYKSVEEMFGFTDNESLYRRFLAYYNQMFDNLLLSFPDLYRLSYFEMKGEIEKELFGLYYSGQLKEELKQSFVSKKIKFLKRLKYFFFNELIELDATKEVMKYLVESIDDYMPAKTSQNAVIEIFEKELAGIGNFWGYVNNIEYSKSQLYGGSHKERFEVYLEEKDRVTSILDVQRDILGGDVIVDIKPADVSFEIKKIFENAGYSEVYVEELDDIHKRFVKVAGMIGGYSFDAEYDREYGYVRNINAYGENLTENSVKINGLEDFLAKKLAEKVGDLDVLEELSSEDGDANSETNAQKIAKAIIAKEITEAGFNTAIDDVEILDPVLATYRLNDLVVIGEVELLVSFTYLANEGNVTSIFVVKEGEGTILTGEFPLEDLKDVITSEYY
jgi:hypothetical protein